MVNARGGWMLNPSLVFRWLHVAFLSIMQFMVCCWNRVLVKLQCGKNRTVKTARLSFAKRLPHISIDIVLFVICFNH